MKKLTLLLTLLMALSCLFIACDSADGGQTTSPETTAADVTTEAPADAATEAPTQAPSTKVTYTVTVKDQNGDPVEGAAVQMCDDKGCKMPAATPELCALAKQYGRLGLWILSTQEQDEKAKALGADIIETPGQLKP